jgi:EAL domain-containing protein (putative c-di-GMP-specific phosphodiesterase class I)
MVRATRPTEGGRVRHGGKKMARILALDDDALVRRAIDRILRRKGHEVIQASQAAQALRLAHDVDFDIALVDHQLPDATGIEVLSKLRALQPRCIRMLITGHLDLPMVKEAVNQGEVSKVIEKPLDQGTLTDAVDGSLRYMKRMQDVMESQHMALREAEGAAMDECLAGDFIQLALQPILDASGAVVAHEALLRSTHPTLHGPMPVLRAAEEHGRLPDLGRVIVDRAARWLAILPANRMLFLNLHPDELSDPEGMAARLEPLRPHAGRVVLEITERRQLSGVEHWERSVELATEMGFRIAVDDLGAGYSSLAVLAELQPSIIKIDMSIVRGVDADERKQRLIELIVSFAKATTSRVVGEGVETEDEADCLRALGVDLFQGYFYGKPTKDVAEVLGDDEQESEA